MSSELGQAQVSVTQDYYLGRKIASEDTAQDLEIIGRLDMAAVLADATSHKPPMGGQWLAPEVEILWGQS